MTSAIRKVIQLDVAEYCTQYRSDRTRNVDETRHFFQFFFLLERNLSDASLKKRGRLLFSTFSSTFISLFLAEEFKFTRI